MVITVLEALVESEKWPALRNAYQEGTQRGLPPQMIQTFLLQGTANLSQWQIVSVWKSREALDEMRTSGEIPAGILMFRAAGVEPKLTVFDVPASAP